MFKSDDAMRLNGQFSLIVLDTGPIQVKMIHKYIGEENNAFRSHPDYVGHSSASSYGLVGRPRSESAGSAGEGQDELHRLLH
jgi:hypothetical protein